MSDRLVLRLERAFRTLAFFVRVPMQDLALIYPELVAYRTKDEFLQPRVRALRQLIETALQEAPADVGRLTEEYPEVAALLRGQV